MLGRGSFSFVAMLVINPIVILFYQNCSMSPMSQAARENPVPVVQQEREIASVMTPEVVIPHQPACAGHYSYYIKTNVE